MKNDSHSFFVDANVVVYSAVQDDHRHHSSVDLLKDSSRGPMYISAQVVTEFFSTITSPKRVTAPFTSAI
jgi:predicted nucleic acid-binding protein